MLKVDKDADYFTERLETTEKQYALRSDDIIDLKVFANNGELLIDPAFEMRKEMSISQGGGLEKPTYQIQSNGEVNLPMVGSIKLAGYTIFQADSLLTEVYGQFYENPYVKTGILNKRVFLLGAVGATQGQMIILENENMTLLEVLAIGGGLPNNSKAKNIRIIRGSLENPEVQIINLKTIAGMQKANLNLQPNDVIYVEPVRKVFAETARDIAPMVALLTSSITLLLLITQISADK